MYRIRKNYFDFFRWYGIYSIYLHAGIWLAINLMFTVATKVAVYMKDAGDFLVAGRRNWQQENLCPNKGLEGGEVKMDREE